MVKVTSNVDKANFLVHDEDNSTNLIVALTILCKAHENLTICRVPTFPDESCGKAIIYDVENGISYNFLDAIWQKYGMTILKTLQHKDAVFEMISNEINDIPMGNDQKNWLIYKSQKSLDECSCEAEKHKSEVLGPLLGEIVFLVKKFDEKIYYLNLFVEVKSTIEKALKKYVKSILVLELNDTNIDDYLEFITFSHDSKLNEVLFLVVYCAVKSNVTVHSIAYPGTFGGLRKTFPRKWWKKSEKSLKRLTGVSDFIACENSGTYGICKSLDAAIAVAKIATDSKK